MKIKEFIRKNYIVMAIFLIASSIISGIFLKELGFKDSAMVLLSTFLLLVEIYLIKNEAEMSILLFIFSWPLIVTARKICNFNILFIRVTYETIYISILFFFNIKNISSKVKNSITNRKNKQFLVLSLLFLIFALNSSIFGKSILDSLAEVYISVVIPIMFLLSIVTLLNKSSIKKIIFALIGSIVLSCFYGFMQIESAHYTLKTISENRDQITFGYHNINIFANILMCIFPFIIELILYHKNTKKEKIFLYFSFIISLIALIITFTRGAWISFLIAVFIILISKKYKKIVYVLMGAFVIVAKPLISYILRRGTSTSFMSDESAIARMQSIFTSVKIMIEYPFGIGGGNYAAKFKEYIVDGYLLMPEQFRHKISVANYAIENAHNLWLQIGVEFGLVCMVLFILMMINRVGSALKNYENNRAAFTSIIMYLIFSVLTGIEFDHKGVITSTLVIWLVFGIILINNEEIKDKNIKKIRES